jgi:hypothetical protein
MDDVDSYSIWHNGTHTYTSRSASEGTIDDGPDLRLALAAADGVSNGATHVIPKLLLPGVLGGSWLRELRDLKDPYPESIDDHLCWHIEAGNSAGDRVDLWIDQRTRLLRRVTRVHHFGAETRAGDSETETTIDYEGEVNTVIPSQLLERPDLGAGVTKRSL